MTGRGTYEKALTFNAWPYFLDRDIQLSLVATNASDSGMVHATYTVHRNR